MRVRNFECLIARARMFQDFANEGAINFEEFVQMLEGPNNSGVLRRVPFVQTRVSLNNNSAYVVTSAFRLRRQLGKVC